MECPQNVSVVGLSSKKFCIKLTHTGKDLNEEKEMIQKLLNYFVEVFDDNFMLRMISSIPINRTNNVEFFTHTIMTIQFEKYFWIFDVAERLSLLQKMTSSYLLPNMEVSINTSTSPLSLQAGNKGMYNIKMCNGVYITKTLTRHVYGVNEEGQCKLNLQVDDL
jgi:hypothetical protein